MSKDVCKSASREDMCNDLQQRLVSLESAISSDPSVQIQVEIIPDEVFQQIILRATHACYALLLEEYSLSAPIPRRCLN